MTKSKKRLFYLDAMKALAVLMVIALHVPLWSINYLSHPTAANHLQYALRLASEGVPIFVFINGFLLLGKSHFTMKRHWQKIKNIFLLLLLWSAILTTIGIFLDPNAHFSLKFLIDSILNTRNESKYSGVLWFLQSLLALYLLVPILKVLYEEHFEHFDYFKYLFIVVSFFTVGLSLLKIVNQYLVALTGSNLLSEAISFLAVFDFINYDWFVFYFMLGGMVYQNLDAIQKYRKQIILLGFVSYVIAVLVGWSLGYLTSAVYNPSFTYHSLFMPVMILALLALFLPVETGEGLFSKLVSSVGQHTMGIYLTHYIFIMLIAKYVKGNSFLMRILIFLIVFALSYLSAIIISKIPKVNRITAM
ncbi:acyltransferase [Lactobacillus sp.]|uniref:acyltransferase n=1 Tax=Lactobacillus sp. TaxID=1591 RepID=UPI003EFB2786